MPEHRPLVRHWIVLRKLAALHYGATVQELAAELGVNERTIRRDLLDFQQAGFPLDEAVGPRGRKTWRLRTTDGRPELSFAFDEALALYLGRRFLDPLAGTPLWEAAQNAFKKVRGCLGPQALAYLDRMAASLHRTAPADGKYAELGEAIDELLGAIADRKATFLVYQSLQSTEPVTYEVHPYALVEHRGSLYLVAYSCEHKQLRHFKVDRIHGVDVSRFPFDRPDNFDVGKHLADSFGVYQGNDEVRVVVRFLAPVVRYVQESRWHPSQQLTPQGDGSLLAEFRLSSTEEIQRWILGFGRHAVVIEPAALRSAVQAELEALLALYDGASRADRTIR